MEEMKQNGMRKSKRIKESLRIPEYIDWSTFNIKDINSAQVIIYVHDLKRDIPGDIEKVNLLRSMKNLQGITINSNDFSVGIYMSEILREVKVKKEFNLLDDFQNKDRKDIESTKLTEGTILRTIPNSYIQWGCKKKNLNYGFIRMGDCMMMQIDSADSSSVYPSNETFEKINNIINEFNKIPDLTLVDKVVLVCNYIQQNVQFVSGKVSNAIDGEYICEEYTYEKYGGTNSVDNVIVDKIGKCNCISRTMMLMLNNPIMNVNCRIMNSLGHAYCSIFDNETEKLYCVDPTWGITRSPNKFEGTLKASKFSYEFILIGQDKLKNLDYHDTQNVTQKEIEEESLSRELIKESIEKLKRYGIKFEYPKVIPLSSVFVPKEKRKTEHEEL